MNFAALIEAAVNRNKIEKSVAREFLALSEDLLHNVLFTASEIKQKMGKTSAAVCSIVNAKSGLCSEDCSFCAQSAHYKTNADTYSLMNSQEIVDYARADQPYAHRFSIVTSGRDVDGEMFPRILSAVEALRKDSAVTQKLCLSSGLMSYEQLCGLKEAGLTRYHHNIETCRSYFPKVCTTHSYDQRIEVIENARKAGLELCVGGIFGLGESTDQQIELLEEIRDIDPEAVPLNFLVPIQGTKLADQPRITPFNALKLIALARIMLPDKDIKLAGGRLETFDDLMPLIFLAGANGMITGKLLTVSGRNPETDKALLHDLGMKPVE